MNIKFLKDLDWGAEVFGVDLNLLSESELRELGRLALDRLVVVIRNQNVTPRNQVRIAKIIGDVEKMPPSIWHRCPSDDLGVISEVQRVTGEKDEMGRPKGLFGHDEELDWHANRASSITDRKDLVWLNSIYGSTGSCTSWLNCERAYLDLDIALKEALEDKRGIFGYAPNRYSSFDEFKTHINPIGIPLVYKNPVNGKKGLYFPFLQLFGIEGMNQDEYIKFVEMLKGQILKEKYIYNHHWADGDIVISDQWLTIHKRHRCKMTGRMLYRLSMDYKNLY